MEFKDLKIFLFSIGESYPKASKRLGMSISAFGKKINGKTSWTLEEMIKFKNIYNLTTEQLLDYFFGIKVAL